MMTLTSGETSGKLRTVTSLLVMPSVYRCRCNFTGVSTLVPVFVCFCHFAICAFVPFSSWHFLLTVAASQSSSTFFKFFKVISIDQMLPFFNSSSRNCCKFEAVFGFKIQYFWIFSISVNVNPAYISFSSAGARDKQSQSILALCKYLSKTCGCLGVQIIQLQNEETHRLYTCRVSFCLLLYRRVRFTCRTRQKNKKTERHSTTMEFACKLEECQNASQWKLSYYCGLDVSFSSNRCCGLSCKSILHFDDHQLYFHANFHSSSTCSLGWQLRRHSTFCNN